MLNQIVKNFNINVNYSGYKGIGINILSLKRVSSFSFLIFTNFEPASEKDSELKTLERNILNPELEFQEFEPRFKSAKTRFKLSPGLNLETFDTILSVPAIFKPRLKFKPLLKLFKFGHRSIN